MDNYSYEFFDKKLKAQSREIRELQMKLEEKKNEYRKTVFQSIGWKYKMAHKLFGNPQHKPF